MSTTTDFDRLARAWLDGGPTQLSDRALEATLAEIHLTRQRRVFRVPWRFPKMPSYLRLAAVVALVAVVGAGAWSSFAGGPGGPPVPSNPPATPTTRPTVVPTASQAGGGPFTSPLHGYTVTRPAGWTVTPATIAWLPGTDPSADVFESPVSMSPEFGAVYVASQLVPDGMTPADWQLEYAESVEASSRDCKGPADAWTDDAVGALEIRRLDLKCQGLPGETLAFIDVAFVIDDRGYVMAGNPTVVAQFLAEIEAGV